MSDATQSTIPGEVSVEMGGRKYRLRGEDGEQLTRLARRVDDALTDIAGPDGPRDDFKVAVLAALNLASDHDEQTRSTVQETAALHERAQGLAQRLRRLKERAESI